MLFAIFLDQVHHQQTHLWNLWDLSRKQHSFLTCTYIHTHTHTFSGCQRSRDAFWLSRSETAMWRGHQREHKAINAHRKRGGKKKTAIRTWKANCEIAVTTCKSIFQMYKADRGSPVAATIRIVMRVKKGVNILIALRYLSLEQFCRSGKALIQRHWCPNHTPGSYSRSEGGFKSM